MPGTNKPFITLGKHLKTVRELASQSLAEVSGAVEIDENQLKLIESGLKRPEEDVMLLLISYFNLADKEALHLWELADYDSDLTEHIDLNQNEPEEHAVHQLMQKPMIMLLSMDIRTMYSDGFEVTWNDAGMTLNFTQSTNKGQGQTVARVGMSNKQVENVIKCLESALLHAKYNGSTKLLPPSSSSKNSSTKDQSQKS